MRTFTMSKRIAKQLIGDRRLLALLFIAPIFVLFLFQTILNSSITNPKIVVDTNSNIPTIIVEELKNHAEVSESKEDIDVLKNEVRDGVYDGLLTKEDNTLVLTVEGTNMSVDNAAQKAFSSTMSSIVKQLTSGTQYMGNEVVYINGDSDMTLFDSIAPMMMGFFIFFFVFLMAGIAFLRERISGTLERLMATPIKRYEVVLGYFFGFGIFVAIQTVIIQSFIIYVLGITLQGSFLLVLLINILLAAGSLSLGTLLSTFARTEFQLIQFIPIVIVPQILFCGIFSIREAPVWVQFLSKIFPLTYAADALTAVVLKGYTFGDVLIDLTILTFYAILFLVLNTIALKKYRKL